MISADFEHFPKLGTLVMQDHRVKTVDGDDLPLHLRAALMCVRVIDRKRDGRFVAQGHVGDNTGGAERSVGDLGLASVLWRPEKGKSPTDPTGRPIPAWFFCAPAVTTEKSRDLRPRPAAGEKTQTRPPEAGTTAVAAQRVNVRPVGDVDYRQDTRFRQIDAALSPTSAALPKGWPGVVLSVTKERKQEELFLPSGGSMLVAVNAAGDPALGSLVYDLKADDSLDADRAARLQSLVRVGRLPTGNGLAWQLTASQQDGLDGFGLTCDRGSLGSTQEKREEPTATTQTSPDGRTATSGGTGATSQYGAASNVNELIEKGSPERIDGQAGGVTFFGPDGKPIPTGTQTRDTPTDANAPGTVTIGGVPLASDQLVYSYMSAKRSGPLEVGHPVDKHRIGATLDGEPINAGHVSIAALYYADQERDGPLDVDGQPYSNPAPAPYRARVYMRWNANKRHPWFGGEAMGAWSWESESVFRMLPIGDPPPKKPRKPLGDPPPPDPPPVILDPTGQSGIGGYAPGWGVHYTPTGSAVRPPDLPVVPEGVLIVNGKVALTSGGFDPFDTGVDPGTGGPTITGGGTSSGVRSDPIDVTDAINRHGMGPLNKPGAIATTTQHVQFGGGTSVTAIPGGRGTWDFATSVGTAFGGLSPAQAKCLDGAPVVARTTGYGRNPAGQWCHWKYATRPRTGVQGVATGGTVSYPGDVTHTQVMSGTALGLTTSKLFEVKPPGLTAIGFATPDEKTGGIKSGFGLEGAELGAQLVALHRDSSGVSGAGTISYSDGSFDTVDAAGDQIIGLDAVDTVVRVADRGATSVSPGNPGYLFSDGVPKWNDTDGTLHAFGGGGGGGMVSGGPQLVWPEDEENIDRTAAQTFGFGAWGPAVDNGVGDNVVHAQVASGAGKPLGFSATQIGGNPGDYDWADYVKVGDYIKVSGTVSNNITARVTAVTADLVTHSGGGTSESAVTTAIVRVIPDLTRTLTSTMGLGHDSGDPDNPSAYKGRMITWQFNLEDGSTRSVDFPAGPTLKADFASFGPMGITADVRVRGFQAVSIGGGATATQPYHGAWSSSSEVLVELVLIDPADASTEIVASRSVTATDSDFVQLTLDDTDLAGIGLPGDQLQVRVRTSIAGWAGDSSPYSIDVAVRGIYLDESGS